MKMIRLTSIMLFLMLISMCVQFSSCGKEVRFVDQQPDTIYVEVPVYIEVPRSYEDEKLTERIEELERDVDYYKIYVDSTKNTIEYKNYINERRIEKIKYYITITERNPNNKKFFYGWVKRTMSD